MNKILKHSVSLIVAVTLVAGPALFGFQEKARADTAGCLASATEALGLSKTGSLLGVPIQNFGVDVTAGETTGSLVQRCIVEPIVIALARALLDNFTAQTVRWINSGFQGSPLYVTNLKGFMSGVADQAIGQYIVGLGPIGSILCSPFDLQLRLALQLQYSSGYYQTIGCRLSDIQQNVQRAFTGGTFGRNGWDNWIQIAGTPQNNPYGAYLNAVNAIDLNIAGNQYTLGKQLDFGKGFLSATDPKTGKITTPGSLIEDQLATTLGEPIHQVGLARDIDSIIGALLGQMIGQVMGGLGGLAGAEGNSNATSYTSSAGGYTYNTIEYNRQAQNLPDGLYMETNSRIRLSPTGKNSPTTPTAFCDQFKKNIYGTADSNPTQASLVSVKVNGTTNSAALAAPTSKVTAAGNTVPWTLADYNNVVAFCKNVDLTTSLTTNTNNFFGNLSNNTASIESAQTKNLNREIILASAALNQSHIYNGEDRYGERGPIHAAVGSGLTDTVSGKHGTELGYGWWTASLNTQEQIDTVQVSSDGRYGGDDYLIILANLAPSKMGRPITPNDVLDAEKVLEFRNSRNLQNSIVIRPTSGLSYSGTFDNLTLSLKTPLLANAIIISSPTRVILTSVKMYRPAVNGNGQPNGPGAPQGPAVEFSPAEQQAKPSVTPPSDYFNPTNRNFSNTFTLSANQTQNGLKARLALFRIDGSGVGRNVPFSTVFDSLKINDAPIDTSQNVAILNSNFSPAQGSSFTHTETGTISPKAPFNDSNFPSYKIVEQIFKTVAGVDEPPIATQTTTFFVR